MSDRFASIVAVHDAHHRGLATVVASRLASDGGTSVTVIEATADVVSRLVGWEGILVVIDAFGGGAPADALFDDLAEAVLTGLTHPVLVIGPHADAVGGTASLIVPVDAAGRVGALLATIVCWTATYPRSQCLVVALDVPDPWPADATDPVVDAGRELIASLGRCGVGVDFDRRTTTDPVAGTMDVVSSAPSAVVAVVAPGSRPSSRGTTMSRRLIRLAPCPVLVIPDLD